MQRGGGLPRPYPRDHNCRQRSPRERRPSLAFLEFVTRLRIQRTVVVELENVRKSYVEPNGHVLPVLDIPRFQVARGEQMVLVGRSGLGKTTLLHIIAGISRADEGLVKIDGREISKLSEAGRDRFRAAKIGYVFQTFNLMPGFSALENVQLGMTFASGRKHPQRAVMLLERVGLLARASHKPAAMSVGEQQRVAVARALANQPAVLLADEPTANVDPANQQKIIDLIRENCRADNVTLIMVTHATEVAAQFDRVDRLEDINQVSKQG
jgi:ABC-type lipoprotein export system ATPase subunit